jgi:hypothetical protein
LILNYNYYYGCERSLREGIPSEVGV